MEELCTSQTTTGRSPEQYQEGKVDVGADWEDTLEGGGEDDILGIFLPHGSACSTLVWRGGMSAHVYKASEDRVSACEFIETGHM